MHNVIKKNILGKAAIFLLAGTVAVGQFAGFFGNNAVQAHAEESEKEIVYYADTIYGDDAAYEGEGVTTTSSYTIDCDQMVVDSYVSHASVPSFGTGDDGYTNVCGPVSGTNIVAFYDRWYTNLIPNYTPGMVTSSGAYRYFPDRRLAVTNDVISDLYELMNIEEIGGTTSANFRNGLDSYAEGKGYDISFSSMYQNATMVNLSKLTTAINQNKVGLVMCSTYNFVSKIQSNSDGSVFIGRKNSTTAHMMMIFGYKTISFYKSGNLVCTKTFLHACSGFNTQDIGFIELNDFSIINEAYIVSVT